MTALSPAAFPPQARCRIHFEAFVREFWECVPGATTLVWNWHMRVLCEELEQLADRVIAGLPRLHDLVINLPFGMSKSMIVSVLFPAWVWTRFPEARFICGTHTDSLALDLAAKSKDVIEGEKYQAYFPGITIRADRAAKDDYANNHGGERKSCTVGGKTPTGRHSHFIIIDDPIDPQGVRSEAELETARRFVTEVIPSRMVDKEIVPTILVMQRLHPRDPTAVMLETAKCEGVAPVRHICLPGEIWGGAETVSPPELAAHYVDGLLDVKRLTARVLKGYLGKLGAFGYAGQIKQKPELPGGGMFKPQYFNQRVKVAPYAARRIRAWDRASTSDGGCFTAGVLMAVDQEHRIYVEHMVAGQWDPDERNARMKATALRDQARYGPRHAPMIWVEAEGGSSGVDAWRGVQRALAGFNVRQERVTGSKDVRAEPWSCALAAGNVYIVDDGTWDVEAFVQEHLLFRPDPTTKRLGKFKDQVDACSLAYNKLVGGPPAGTLKVLSFGSQKGLRLVVADGTSLGSFMTDRKGLLVYFDDPPPEGAGVPYHALDMLLEPPLVLTAADVDPAELQECWNEDLAPYGRKPEEVIITPEHGKKLWSYIRRQRGTALDILVLAERAGRRALSAAYAVADVLGLKRQEAVWVADRDAEYQHEKAPAPNPHVYATIQTSRSLVL